MLLGSDLRRGFSELTTLPSKRGHPRETADSGGYIALLKLCPCSSGLCPWLLASPWPVEMHF